VRVQKQKRQIFITIPRDVARLLELNKGDEVIVTVSGKQGVFKKLEAQK